MNKANKTFRVLIFCGVGYIFREIFEPIINPLSYNCQIDLLIVDYYLADDVLKLIKELKRSNYLSSYHVLSVYNENKSYFARHRELNKTINLLKSANYDLFIIGQDYDWCTRYLIDFVKLNKTKIVILKTGTIWRVLGKYIIKNNFSKNIGHSRGVNFYFTNHKKWPQWIKNVFLKQKRFLFKQWNIFKNYYLFPFLFSKRIFKRNKYDDFAFASTRADVVLCYDQLEFEALQTIVPEIKKLLLIKHPAENYFCQCKQITRQKKKILVGFTSNLTVELEANKCQRWVEVVSQAVRLTGAEEVHLRPHPRTSPQMVWPQKMRSEIIKNTGCEVILVNSLNVPLIETICHYIGIIGAPSGSLVLARAICKNLFIIGLPNCGEEGSDEQHWALGNAEGIAWLQPGEPLTKQHLKIIGESTDQKPSAMDILKSFLLTSDEQEKMKETIFL